MVYGLLAGLCLLPVVLSLIGPDPYPDAEDFKAPASSHIWYRSELMSRHMSLKIPRPQLVRKLTLKAPPIICSRRQFQILLFFFKNNK